MPCRIREPPHDEPTTQRIEDIAIAMVAEGQGILAADESTATIQKRFNSINAENTETNRRDYREMLFRSTEAMNNYVSGVILFEETLFQKAADGTPFVELIRKAGARSRHQGRPGRQAHSRFRDRDHDRGSRRLA